MPNTVTKTQMAAETVTWRDRVRTAGGGLEWNSVFVANTLVKQLKAKSYFAKIIYLMPYLGTGVTASLVPLIDRYNFGAPTNTNFVNADFTQSTGLQGNNSNKVLTFPFFLSQLGSNQNGGVGFWGINTSMTNNTQYAFGTSAVGAADPIYALRFGAPVAEPVCEFAWGTYTNRVTLAEARSNSHYYGNRSSTTSRLLYKNGALAASSVVSDSSAQTTTLVPASYALNQTNSFAVYWGGSKGVEYYTDGTMSDDDVTSLHSILATYLMGPAGRI